MVRSEELGSVIKALDVLQAFSSELPRATVSEIADRTGITRPSARRILLTFVDRGFVETDGKFYWLTAKVMRLGFSYLSALPFWELAQPHMRALAEEVDESCSLATLDSDVVVYVARVPIKKSVIQLNIGSRLPAHATALGKALWAHAPESELNRYLEAAPFEALTPNTVTTAEGLRAQLAEVRQRGFAVNDGEREIGVRSVAAPIFDRTRNAIAALNISANAMRISHSELEGRVAPLLLRTTRAISEEISFNGR